MTGFVSFGALPPMRCGSTAHPCFTAAPTLADFSPSPEFVAGLAYRRLFVPILNCMRLVPPAVATYLLLATAATSTTRDPTHDALRTFCLSL